MDNKEEKQVKEGQRQEPQSQGRGDFSGLDISSSADSALVQGQGPEQGGTQEAVAQGPGPRWWPQHVGSDAFLAGLKDDLEGQAGA